MSGRMKAATLLAVAAGLGGSSKPYGSRTPRTKTANPNRKRNKTQRQNKKRNRRK